VADGITTDVFVFSIISVRHYNNAAVARRQLIFGYMVLNHV